MYAQIRKILEEMLIDFLRGRAGSVVIDEAQDQLILLFHQNRKEKK